jgi:hypothetical protein
MNGPEASSSTAPAAAEFGQRDAAIRVNSYTTVRRRDGVRHEVFAAYWRDVHGPLCSRLPGLGWYVQHHFSRRQDAHLWPPIPDVSPAPGYVLDGAVEIGFASAEDQAVFQDASPILFSDEQNVFQETVAYDLPGGSITMADHLPDPVPNGRDPVDRLHVHLSPPPGAEDDLVRFVRDELAPSFLTSPHLAKLRIHLPDRYDNTAPSPPAPNVAHQVSPERESLAILEIAFPGPLQRRAFFDSEAFASTAAGQARWARYITSFPVAGVHTFVRDGLLTTAGLRGSRVAELIDDLAAVNQVSPAVQHLIATGLLDATAGS